MKRKPDFFYGWIIVAVCGFSLLVVFGIRLSFTVFFVALLDEFQWARADISLIFSVSMVVFALFSTFAGMALDRWGARRVFSSGALILALGLFLSSRVQTLTQLTISYGVVAGIGITILGLGPQASIVARWFRRRRGVAIGITFAGTGIGTLLLTPGTEYLVSYVGWRTAYVLLGWLALAIIPAILFLRMSPQRLGLLPDGDFERRGTRAIGTQSFTEKHGDSQRKEREKRKSGEKILGLGGDFRREWTMGEAVRTRAFWLLMVAGFGAIGPLRMLTVHQLAVMVDVGVDRLAGAAMIGFAGVITAVSFILWGVLSDRIGRRLTYLFGSACLLAAIAILGSYQPSTPSGWLIGYAIMLGMGEGSRASLLTAVASDLFPGKSMGGINGAVGSAFGAGAALFPWWAGRIFDLNGSYTVAFETAVIGIVISALALWMAVSTEKTQFPV